MLLIDLTGREDIAYTAMMQGAALFADDLELRITATDDHGVCVYLMTIDLGLAADDPRDRGRVRSALSSGFVAPRAPAGEEIDSMREPLMGPGSQWSSAATPTTAGAPPRTIVSSWGTQTRYPPTSLRTSCCQRLRPVRIGGGHHLGSDGRCGRSDRLAGGTSRCSGRVSDPKRKVGT